MSGGEELPEPIRACLGATSSPWNYEVTSTGIRAFARAAGYRELVYYDAAVARAAGYRDLPAPPGFLGTPVYLPGGSDEVFSEPSLGQPHVPHGLERVLDLGTETEHLAPLHAGDTLTGTTRITEIEPWRGQDGAEGLLIVRELTLVDDRTGAVAARQRRSTLYTRTLR